MPATANSDPQRVRLNGLTHDAFVSPTDKIALDNLKRLPALELVMRKFNELALDRLLYAENSAESVRCSEKQFKTLHGILKDACATLDMPEPELYIRYSAEQNAYTAGVGRTFITLHSSLIDGFTDDELRFVIGHELGHIKCGHVLYMMMARMLMPLFDIIGKVTLGIGRVTGIALVTGFFEWLRQAEFSADRAGLLACQDKDVALSALMKLGSGSSRFNKEMSIESFLEQAHKYSEEKGPEGIAKVIMFLLYNHRLSHPQVVFRAKELDAWASCDWYAGIIDGRIRQTPPEKQASSASSSSSSSTGTKRCKKCGARMSGIFSFCEACGA